MIKKEPYDELLKKIDSLGPINQIVTNPDTLNRIIAYEGDRHLLCALFDRINEAKQEGLLIDSDLDYLRSGQLMDKIINLDIIAAQYAKRQLDPSERLDKINYVSLINDEQVLAASYTHPAIIDALCGEAHYDKNPHDLVWFKSCGTFANLSPAVKSTIVAAVLEKGNIDVAKELLTQTTVGLKSYIEANDLGARVKL